MISSLFSSPSYFSADTLFAILSYSICSSTLLIANKLTVFYLPLPSLISLIQTIVSLFIMLFLFSYTSIPYDPIQYDKVKKYFIYVLAFTVSRYANMKALEQSNIETVIIFRSCIPLTLSFVEYYFLNRSLPSLKSFISLFIIALSALMYCICDSEFILHGLQSYTWVILYFIILTFELTYCKILTSSVQMKTNWGPVFYCNFLAVIPMIILSYLVGDLTNDIWYDLYNLPLPGVLILLFSCVAGTFIGYSSWLCVKSISATSYALVGVLNKFLTVFLNILMWKKQSSSFMSLFPVCLCLIAGTFYEQAPSRDKKTITEFVKGV